MQMQVIDLETVARSLTEALDLSQPPVAVAFRDTVPEGVPLYGVAPPAGCRFWQEAATRVFATTTRHHEFCAIGVYTHHLESSAQCGKDLEDTLKVCADLGYVRPEDVALIPVLQSAPKNVIYGPLARIPVAPDLVLLFVKSSQTLILTEAAQQVENGAPPAMGRPACAIVPQAYNSGRTALSLGCCGARAYLDILTPEMALFAIPAAILEAFADRVAVLARANRVLTSFHMRRRKDIEAGESPTVAESLLAFQ